VARIVFLAPFATTEISGGIKTAYRHAELLTELGFDACVFQPGGAPSWFETTAKVLTQQFAPLADDIVVFPETLNGPLVDMVQNWSSTRKVLFSQAHYYALFSAIPPERYRELGFERVVCQSTIAKGFLERVMGLPDVAVIPCYIDRALFHPRPKTPQIALIPRKLPREAAAIQRIFRFKYPQFAGIGWHLLKDTTERQTAEAFGRSMIVLSLPYLESFGLVPLEAMASGAIVVGFHGYGGQEYATKKNGFWFPPDCLEETADAIAHVVIGWERRDPAIRAIGDEGMATVARYGKEQTKAALKDFYGALVR
jgi:glycosyltransferase involved in cell wall biosynthesis